LTLPVAASGHRSTLMATLLAKALLLDDEDDEDEDEDEA
jgi:hypothetical protein